MTKMLAIYNEKCAELMKNAKYSTFYKCKIKSGEIVFCTNIYPDTYHFSKDDIILGYVSHLLQRIPGCIMQVILKNNIKRKAQIFVTSRDLFNNKSDFDRITYII